MRFRDPGHGLTTGRSGRALPARWYLAFFALALVLPLLTLAAITGYRYVRSEHEHLEGQARLAAGALQESVLREIERATFSLYSLAACDCLLSGDLARFREQAELVSLHTGNRITIEGSAITDPISGQEVTFLPEGTKIDILVRIEVEVLGEDGYRVVAQIPELTLTRLLQRFSRARGWSAMLIDRQGRFVTSTDATSASIPALSPEEMQRLWKESSGSWSGLTATGTTLAAFSTMPEPGLAVVVAIPDTVIAGLVRDAASLLAAFGAAALLIVWLSAYVLANRLSDAISGLAVSAEKVRRGEQIDPIRTEIEEVNSIAMGLTSAVNAQSRSLQERNAAYDLLAMEEARMRSVLEAAPVALVIHDIDGTIQSFSAAAERLFGIPRTDMIGKPIQDILPEDAMSGTDAGFVPDGSPSFYGAAPRLGSARLPGGERFPVEIATSTVRLHDRTLITCFIRDLREEQRLQDELHHAHRMEALGQLTGGIAHDFNNLLTVINGNLEMALKARSHGRSIPLIREAQAAAEIGAALVHQLLAFGRRQRLTPERIDTGELVHEICKLLRRSLGERIRLDVSGVEPGHGARLDIAQFQSAIINIAVNARDAMPNGGTLRISVTRKTFKGDAPAGSKLGDGTYVVVALTDTGTGMSALTKARAFEPFFTTKPPASGTGLGLSMVYGFASQSGGYAMLESRPRKGTTVTLYLPHHPLDKHQPGISREVEGRTWAPQETTILVVEDHEQVRRITMRRLQELGYKVVSAADGQSALRTIENLPEIDLVLTDVSLPGDLNGDELAQRIRKRASHRAVILMSGYANSGRLRLLRNEVSGWLGKPHRIEELDQAIRTALRTRESLNRQDGQRARPSHSQPSAPI